MNQDWLAQLAPAHAPPPPGWWPPAPGWWVLALLLPAVLGALLYWWTRPAQRLRRAALKELASLSVLPYPELAPRLQDLLRRYAVARYGRAAVARLAGRAWLDFLASHGAAGLAGPAGERLLQAAYAENVASAPRGHAVTAGEGNVAPAARRPATPDDAPLWLSGARAFITTRQRSAKPR